MQEPTNGMILTMGLNGATVGEIAHACCILVKQGREKWWEQDYLREFFIIMGLPGKAGPPIPSVYNLVVNREGTELRLVMGGNTDERTAPLVAGAQKVFNVTANGYIVGGGDFS